MNPKSLNSDQESVLAIDYQNGYSLKDLGVKYAINHQTASNILGRLGVARRTSVGYPKPEPRTKECSACKRDLEVTTDNFYFTNKGKPKAECKICFNKRSLRWYQNNTSKSKALSRNSTRARLYSWSQGRFDWFWKKQSGRCAICQVLMLPTGRGPTSVHVDHDHATGKPRALLCSLCNRGIGIFRDSPEHLRAAAEYLIKYPSKTAKKAG